MLCVFAGIVGITQTSATAQIIDWTNTNGGTYSTGSNWAGGIVPNGNQTARFGGSGRLNVNFTGSASAGLLIVQDADRAFHLGGNTYATQGLSLGLTIPGDTTSLEIRNGTLQVYQEPNSSLEVFIGRDEAGGSREFFVGSGGVALIDKSLTILGGNGRITVAESGVFEHRNGQFLVATGAVGSGSMSVSGLGSTMRLHKSSVWGQSGTATLSLSSGGLLETFEGVTLAQTAGSTAIADVSSNWNHYGGVITLGGGTGTINVIQNGNVQIQGSNSDIFAGANDSITITDGSMTISGAGKGNGIILSSGATMSVIGAGSLNISSTGAGSGITLNSGSTLTQTGGTISTTNFTRAGTYTQNAGSFTVDGGVFNNSSASLNLGGTDATSINLVNGANTTNLTGLIVGSTNTAFSRELNVLSGSKLTTNGASTIGQFGSGSIVRVSGPSSTWTSGGGISVGQATGTLVVENGGVLNAGSNAIQTGVIGAGSNGIVAIRSGGRVNAGNVELSRVAGSVSTTTVTGTGSELNAAGLFIGGSSGGVGGTASLTIADGATVHANGTTRVRAAGTLNLNGGSLTTTNFTRDATGVFNFGGGTLTVAGSFANSGDSFSLAGATFDDNPTLILEGNGNTSGILFLTVGSLTRKGTLTLNPGSQLIAPVSIRALGTVNLNGGSMLVSSFDNSGVMNWNSGAVKYTTSATLDSATLTGLLGSAHNLRDNQTLGAIGGTLTLGSTLNVNGGTFSPFNLTNNSTLTLNQGNVEVAGTLNNNAGRTVQINGVSDLSAATAINNSGTIRMNSVTSSLSGGQLTNNTGGTISGTGQINNDFDNIGIVRVSGSEHLVFTGGIIKNAMNMNISGGTLEFTQTLSNRNGAAITGRGTLVGSSANPGGLGLDNDGLMSFSAGTMDIFGDVDQSSGGRIVTSGNGVTTFFDDVVHNGIEIRTFLGSTTVFLGAQSGAGIFTGTGVVEYAGDLRPGNSPAVVTYEGDVRFNSSVNSFFELGGTGTNQFDQLQIAGDLELAGNLSVSLINSFGLSANDEFLILDVAGNRTGFFNGLGEGSLVGQFGGFDLFITYRAGIGENDVALFSLRSVPEPTSLFLVSLMGSFGILCRRRRASVAIPSIDI